MLIIAFHVLFWPHDPLEEGMATHCSILAGIIPWTEEPGMLQPKRSQESNMTELVHVCVELTEPTECEIS